MAEGFTSAISSEEMNALEKEVTNAVGQQTLINQRYKGLNTPEAYAAKKEAEQRTREAKIRYREMLQVFKQQVAQEAQNRRMQTQFKGVVDIKDILDKNITALEYVDPDYSYVDPNRQLAASAYKNALKSRDLLAGTASNYAPYASGQRSYARELGKLDSNAARSAIVSRLAGNRGGGAAASQLAERAIGEQTGAITDRARVASVAERLESAKALSDLYSLLGQTDVGLQNVAKQNQYGEAAMAQQLADYQYQYNLDQQARDQGLFNTVLSTQQADSAADVARRADAANRRMQGWKMLADGVGAAAGAVGGMAGG